MKYFAIWYLIGILGCILVEVKRGKDDSPFEAILIATIICGLLGPIMLGAAISYEKEDDNG